jgi:hypothetical protein
LVPNDNLYFLKHCNSFRGFSGKYIYKNMNCHLERPAVVQFVAWERDVCDLGVELCIRTLGVVLEFPSRDHAWTLF